MDRKYYANELTKYSKSDIIDMFISLQRDTEKQGTQIQELNQKMDLLLEQLSISKQQRFGRS